MVRPVARISLAREAERRRCREALSWAHVAPSAADAAAPSRNPTAATDDATSAATAPSGATSAAGATTATAAGLQSFSSASTHQVTPSSIFRRCY